MNYVSTRGADRGTSFSEAVIRGLASDGGLFVPEEQVRFSGDELRSLIGRSYAEIAEAVIARYAADFTADEIRDCVEGAYCSGKFPEVPVGMTALNGTTSVLELYHGPTCAFKDMALQILPRFMVKAIEKCGEKKQIVILTATSGDTGKAALEGFRDVPGIKVMVFYPEKGVSAMQKQQMITQEGGNVNVTAIYGNFDNAQTGVKKIFSDRDFAAKILENGSMLSSANSINWGRLLPQIVYYFYAYLYLAEKQTVAFGEPVNFTVPTGNFGDILACYYAKKAGLPVGRILCASNSNSVVADFLCTGTYDKKREFLTTMSPAMDILVSSNLERLLFDAVGRDSGRLSELMKQLNEQGDYSVTAEEFAYVAKDFVGGSADEQETVEAMRSTWEQYGYLTDPHTAVGIHVYRQYAERTGDKTHTVCVSTASPFKFNASVAESLFGSEAVEGLTEFELLDFLSEKTGAAVPGPLSGLDKRPVRFRETVKPEEMKAKVENFVNE